MKLITKKLRAALITAGTAASHTGETGPVLAKLFTPDANATWLICDAREAENPNDLEFFGLADLGHGEPELCYFLLSDVESLRGSLGLPVERDQWFTASKTLMEYADAARAAGAVYA
jgi:hypothetical protein